MLDPNNLDNYLEKGIIFNLNSAIIIKMQQTLRSYRYH